MSYNMTALQAVDSVGELFVYVNYHSNEMLTSGLIIAMFFILFMSLKRYAFEDALATSSFFCMLLSILGSWAGLLNYLYALFFVLLTAIGAWLVYEKNHR